MIEVKRIYIRPDEGTEEHGVMFYEATDEDIGQRTEYRIASDHDRIVAEKDAMIARLREALQQIADGYDGTGARVQGTGYPDAVQQFARKALEVSDER